MQADQQRRLLDAGGLATEVVEREFAKAELVLRRGLPQEIEVDGPGLGVCCASSSRAADTSSNCSRTCAALTSPLAAAEFHWLTRRSTTECCPP
jgi:hypothetical protein